MLFINPLYEEISSLRTERGSYDEALTNSKELEKERERLTQKYNTVSMENLERLTKLLPQNVDNIRLILEIEQIATPYGMTLRDVRYNAETPEGTGGQALNAGIQGGYVQGGSPDYGVWDLQFVTRGTYDNFVSFIKDLERNLRIVDISAVEFSSETAASVSSDPISSQQYEYRFSIRTYWLRN